MSLTAIFSDVHGNLPALMAVLNDIDKRNVDQVFCLGDLIDFAPWTNEVIELIRTRHISCIMGNHDERVAFDKEVIPLAKHSTQETTARIAAVHHTRKVITAENKKYLRELPRSFVLTYKNNAQELNVTMVHGSTRSNSEYIYENHDVNDVYTMLDENRADILLVGHTHVPYIRRIPARDNQVSKYVMNCGSVGRSRENSRLASYLLLDINNENISSEIVRLDYPVAETIQAILHSDIPNFYADFFTG